MADDFDWDDPSTYPLKQLSAPEAYPQNGPPWLFEGSTPAEIEAMQHAASESARNEGLERELQTGEDATVEERALATLRAAADAPETITFGS